MLSKRQHTRLLDFEPEGTLETMCLDGEMEVQRGLSLAGCHTAARASCPHGQDQHCCLLCFFCSLVVCGVGAGQGSKGAWSFQAAVTGSREAGRESGCRDVPDFQPALSPLLPTMAEAGCPPGLVLTTPWTRVET